MFLANILYVVGRPLFLLSCQSLDFQIKAKNGNQNQFLEYIITFMNIRITVLQTYIHVAMVLNSSIQLSISNNGHK